MSKRSPHTMTTFILIGELEPSAASRDAIPNGLDAPGTAGPA